MERKLFNQMSDAEQNAWLTDFQQWYASQLPQIEKGAGMSADMRKAFEHGLDLLSVYPYCRAFVKESLQFKDYGARKRLLRRYADKVAQEAQATIGFAKKVDLTDPKLLEPHVGRPTLDEAAARALKAEQDRLAAEQQEQTLFGKKADVPVLSPAAPDTVSGSVGGGELLRLDELKWLLSPELREAVETVRELRQQSDEAAAAAKALAEAGNPEEQVAPYSEAAVKFKQKYEDIYQRVDDEMARVYVRLKEDTTYIKAVQEAKADPQEWRTKLRPYWDKFDDNQKAQIKQSVIDYIKANDPEQAKIREAEEKKKKQAADLIKYLTRKDKKNTPRRVNTMEERYKELVALIGEEEAKTYLPVLEAARRDAENYKNNTNNQKENDDEEEK